MKVEPKKVMAFLKRPGFFNVQAMASEIEETEDVKIEPEEIEEIQEELTDDMSEASQMQRKLGSGYMELNEAAGAFSCGNCRFSTEEGVCLNMMIRAPVSAENGCCNYFEVKPETGIKVVFPMPEGEDGEHEVEGEHEEKEEPHEQHEGHHESHEQGEEDHE